MTAPVSRRALMRTAAAAATAPWLLGPARALAALASGTAGRRLLEPFAPGTVTLRPGEAADALAVNRRYLLALDPDRLLHMFA